MKQGGFKSCFSAGPPVHQGKQKTLSGFPEVLLKQGFIAETALLFFLH